MNLETSIDESGNIKIPKAIRDQLNLEVGSVLQVSLQGDALLISEKPHSRSMQELEKFDQAMAKWQGAMPRSLAEDGFASVDDYVRAMRSR